MPNCAPVLTEPYWTMSYLRFLLAGIALLALAACGQPETGTAPESAAADSSEAAANEGAMDEKLVSIDADGNIAPFGFASKQPVEVSEPEAPAAPAEAAAAAPATSELYGVHCVACHGIDAKGVQGLGLTLVDSEFVAGKSEAELGEFLKAGRLPDSPDSVTGVPMPGFAWMNEEQLGEITGYLKSLQN